MEEKLIVKVKDFKFQCALTELRDANVNIGELIRDFIVGYIDEENAA